MLVSRVGMNWAVVVKAVEGTVPFRTWYWRTAVRREGSFWRAVPVEVLRILLNALLLGAKIVIPCAEERAETRAGWVARRPWSC